MNKAKSRYGPNCHGLVNARSGMLNRGCQPLYIPKTQYEMTLAIPVGMMTSDSNSGEKYMTSAANIVPANGARKIAPIPEPMPAAISTRRSAGRSRNKLANREPKPAPICAMGPSRPPDPPVPNVKALATIFTNGTRGRIWP
jgi:hypothetical protein